MWPREHAPAARVMTTKVVKTVLDSDFRNRGGVVPAFGFLRFLVLDLFLFFLRLHINGTKSHTKTPTTNESKRFFTAGHTGRREGWSRRCAGPVKHARHKPKAYICNIHKQYK